MAVEKMKLLSITGKEENIDKFISNYLLDSGMQPEDALKVLEKGWREKLEKIWNEDTTRLRYNYNWSLDENNNPIVNFYIDKIHSRKDYMWIHPVHEILKYNKDKEVIITTDDITVNHYPDKSKDRSSYLPLLELSVKENQNND